MITHKPCKGNGKTKGHGCDTITDVRFRKFGLCMSCYANWLYTSKDGKDMIAKATLKASKPRKDLETATKIHKDRKGLTSLIKSVVNVCHEYIRLRDKHKSCIACGTEWKSDFQASHFYKAELYSSLKLNENNIFGGCVECNIRKDGNLSEYTVNLPKRIGVVKFEELNHLANLDHSLNFKWDREDLKRIRKEYQLKLKNIK